MQDYLKIRPKNKQLNMKKIKETIKKFYLKYGKLFIFVGRFLPGLRMPIFLFAGIFRKVKPATFFFIDLIASVISVPIWVYVGYYFGGDLKKLKAFAIDNTNTIGILLIFVLFLGHFECSFFFIRAVYKN